VFWDFAWMMVDAARARQGERHVTWRLDGVESFRAAVADRGGALLLTAHMGNYDVAGPIFADKFGRTVHGVRRPERRADLQAYMETQRDARSGSGYKVQYNVEGGFLGLDLARALSSGEVVAIQGDRVGDGMGEVEVEWRGRLWRLPSGPLVLAQVAAVSIFPVFTIREGWRSYRIVFLSAREPDPPAATRAERSAQLRSMIQWWASTLAGVLDRHWSRWLMFERAFDPLSAGPGAREGAAAAAISVTVSETVAEPSSETPSRPEQTTPGGWRPVAQPISRTSLGRYLNARGLLLPEQSPHQLRAEDSAQNWVEVAVLAGFSGLLAAAAAWEMLEAALPWAGAMVVFPITWFFMLQAVPAACAAVAEAVCRFPGVSARWSVGRLTEEFVLGIQSALAMWLLTTRFPWIGGAWLAFAAANAVCFLVLRAGKPGGPDEETA